MPRSPDLKRTRKKKPKNHNDNVLKNVYHHTYCSGFEAAFWLKNLPGTQSWPSPTPSAAPGQCLLFCTGLSLLPASTP